MKYCAIALQAAVEEKLRIVSKWLNFLMTISGFWWHNGVTEINKLSPIFVTKLLILIRNNTIEDPEFKQALSDLNPDVIYEKLKVICKRNAKEKFILLRHHVPNGWAPTTASWLVELT